MGKCLSAQVKNFNIKLLQCIASFQSLNVSDAVQSGTGVSVLASETSAGAKNMGCLWSVTIRETSAGAKNMGRRPPTQMKLLLKNRVDPVQ